MIESQTPEQAANLAQLQQRWEEGAPEPTPLPSRRWSEACLDRRFQSRDSAAAQIDRLWDGRGAAHLLKLAAEIAENGKHERDRLKAVELLLAYKFGRPAQTVMHADVTPQWAEHQIRQRYPHFDDSQVSALIAKLAARGALPDPE
jgi:hypothetical protein